MAWEDIIDRMNRRLARLRFAEPVAQVYNPLHYARAAHLQYLSKYGKGHKPVVLVGMNPGPWGMVQTGVPFGEVNIVRDWLKIDAEISRPKGEHAKRPVLGLACTRSEVSGARLWGWARDRYGTPAKFFKQFAVLNYCPLAFLEASGRNRTPDKLPAAERAKLFAICDEALAASVALLKPGWVIGVGKFAADRARAVIGASDEAGGASTPRVGQILHPSPASPAANRGWVAQAEAQLRTLGIALAV